MTESPTLPPVRAASRWRSRLAQARPDWAVAIDATAARPVDAATIGALLAAERGDGWRDEAALNRGLRRVRSIVVAALLDRDVDGRADLAEVMAGTTALAEAVIGAALAFHSHALADVHGVPVRGSDGRPQDLLVIGMGKLGGGELNVSSDVDLIFVYPEEGETRPRDGATAGAVRAARPITNAEFFTRLGRKLIATLSEVTADGFVFRVDMRLRPDGDSGPLVTHFAMLERYLVGSARDWERFAWIKARVMSPPVFVDAAAGPADDGGRSELAALVAPFVYRRYLDFGAIDALRQLHGQIRDEAARREAARSGRTGHRGGAAGERAADRAATRIDVKLGRGGIREIEFIAQHFQLIRGGREPELRLQPTLATLDRLGHDGLLEADTAAMLREAYTFLRNVEHRLQYLDDAQTHTLPARDLADDCERIGTLCARLLDGDPPAAGVSPFDALVAALERRRRAVEQRFDAVFAAEPERVSDDGDGDGAPVLWKAFAPGPAADDGAAALRERVTAAGFVPPDGAYARIAALARSARLRGLSSSARTRLDALVPRVIDASRAEADPTATLGRWFDLVETIAGRSAYLALLDEFPTALQAVTRLLAASPWAAQYLTRHPLLLDDLIAPRDDSAPVRDAAAWTAYWRDVASDLARQLAASATDPERQMDVLREVHHGETFQLLIDDLGGRLTVEMLSDQLSALADLILEAAVAHAWRHFVAGRADEPPLPAAPAFAIIGYGKLGGKELGYGSDLDVVFLYDHRADPDQARAIAIYGRFAQRLNVWLTARTAAGVLFDLDLRLRPDGAAGLVVSSFDAWSRYERREHDVGAWTWEHQALTRARFCAGDAALGAAFEAERVLILCARRPDAQGRAQLRAEIVAMRERMHDGHPNRSAAFDLKHDEGGMVDIEFAVQYLVLAYGHAHPSLLADAGNIALLERAADAGLVDRADAQAAADAYRLYRARQHASRLADPGARAARVDGGAYAAERASVRRLWRHLFADGA